MQGYWQSEGAIEGLDQRESDMEERLGQREE